MPELIAPPRTRFSFSTLKPGGAGGRHPESTFHSAPLHSRGDLRFGWCNNSGIDRVGPLLLHTCSGAWQRIRLSLAQAALCSRTHPTPRSEYFRLTPRPSARGFQGALEIFVLSSCGGGGTRALLWQPLRTPGVAKPPAHLSATEGHALANAPTRRRKQSSHSMARHGHPPRGSNVSRAATTGRTVTTTPRQQCKQSVQSKRSGRAVSIALLQ